MVRVAAAIALALGSAVLLFFFHVLGKGPFETLEARHLRAMKERIETPVAIEPMSPAEFYALPQGLSVAEYSGIERRAVAVEGLVPVMLRASDGDLHLELVAPADSAAGYPRYLTAEITPGWRGQLVRDGIDSPGWGYERLAAVFRAHHGTNTGWEGGPARVRLSGWLLYDDGGDVLEKLLGIRRTKRATEWEIHPVTKIERWDAAALAWTEVRR